MKKINRYIAFISIVVAFAGLSGSKQADPSLKEAYQDHFYVGAALNKNQIKQNDYRAIKLVKEHFNSITPENVMKWENIHPGPEAYNFGDANDYVRLGEQNDMFTIGHTLVWHSQLPDWVTAGKDGDTLADYETLMSRIKTHVAKVAGKYRGKIDGWDVVNEALNDDGTYRKSGFYKISETDYIKKAFQYAHRADPNAELYYNDYNLWMPDKRDGAIRLIKMLQSEGIQVDGIGMQGHWGLDYPSLEQIEASIKQFSELGIKVMITELDITVLKNPWDVQGADVDQSAEGGGEEMNPYPDRFPDSMQTKLAKRYQDIFKIFMKYKDDISRITFWGVHDGQSWLNNWPIAGRTNYPLLFDRNYKSKPAYDAVINVAH